MGKFGLIVDLVRMGNNIVYLLTWLMLTRQRNELSYNRQLDPAVKRNIIYSTIHCVEYTYSTNEVAWRLMVSCLIFNGAYQLLRPVLVFSGT